jgi:hypothetical protein
MPAGQARSPGAARSVRAPRRSAEAAGRPVVQERPQEQEAQEAAEEEKQEQEREREREEREQEQAEAPDAPPRL